MSNSERIPILFEPKYTDSEKSDNRSRVPVPPFIRIRNKVVLVRNQNPATLECEVEAFPEPVVHWERGDGRRLKISDKYRTEIYDRRDYKVNFIEPHILRAILSPQSLSI